MTEEQFDKWVLRTAWAIVGALVFFALCLLCATLRAEVVTTQASWYSTEESKGLTASGQELNDKGMTCASWDYPFGTVLNITNEENGRAVLVVVNDRGPSRKLYNRGRRLDLSKGAFACISDLKRGIINVKVEVVDRD